MFTKGLTGFEIIKGIFKQKNTKKKNKVNKFAVSLFD